MNFIENESPTKLRGGYYTDPDIAHFLARWVFELEPQKILEPSCGDGVFISAVNSICNRDGCFLLGIEKDPDEAYKASQRAQAMERVKAEILSQDFLNWGLLNIGRPLNFDAVLGNPPFIRYQYLNDAQQILMQKLFELFHLPFTKHTNAWIPFVVLSIALMRPGGRLAMVVPSELLHVLHAQSLRTFLASECSRILIIDPEELWFGETLQGVVLLLAEKKESESSLSLGVAITPVRDRRVLKDAPGKYFKNAEYMNGEMIRGKWMPALLTGEERELLKEIAHRENVFPFREIASVDVGIVTGANKFFLVTDEVVEKYRLSRWAYPMFGRSEHAPGVIYNEETHEANKKAGLPTNFLWFGAKELSGFPESVQEYIRKGEREELHHRYKCRIRTPWYNVPSVYSSPVGMLKRSHDYPRLILNEANAYTTDTAYRISVKSIDPGRLVYSFVNSLTALTAELEGRHYGGGVLELVPSEIEKLLVPISEAPILLERLDRSIRAGLRPKELFSIQNRELLGEMGLTVQEQEILFEAWNRLRMRRQRASGDEDVESSGERVVAAAKFRCLSS
ncbi:MAG: N-6 DNA methylase [Blastocatellia bacterium]|nr:N-6 DNA methylase [Blastocatellia bacterium]